MELKDANGADVFAEPNHGFVYVLQAISFGNVTESGIPGVNDLVRLAQHLAGVPGKQLFGNALYLADTDRNGKVDVADLVLLARHLADPENVLLGIPHQT